MQKIIDFIKKHKFLILLAVITAFVCVVSIAWVYGFDVKRAADKSMIESLYPGADTATAEIEHQKSVQQFFYTDKSVSGVILGFNTNNQVINGKVTVEVHTKDALLTSAILDMSTIAHNTEVRILFDDVIPEKTSPEYILKIFTEYDNPDGQKLSLWKDPSVKVALYENDIRTNGAIFLTNIITNGDVFMRQYYTIIASLLIIAVAVMFMVIFIFKAKLHVIFFIAVMLFGSVYNFVIVPNTAPDEQVHINTSYVYANRILGIEDNGYEFLTNKDYASYRMTASHLDTFAYKTVYNQLFKSYETKESFYYPIRVAIGGGASPLSYTPTVIGILLTKVFNPNYVTMVIIARMFNLLFFAFIVALAIKIIPHWKNILFAVGFLPMCVSLAASFSYDVFIISLSILFFAICVKYAYGEKNMGKKEIAILAVLAAIMAPCKAIYIFLIGFCLIIPKAKFKNLKHYLVSFGVVFACAIISFVSINFSTVLYYFNINPQLITFTQELPKANAPKNIQFTNTDTDNTLFENEQPKEPPLEQTEEVAPEQPPQVSYVATAYYTPSYILSHKRDTVKLIGNTIQNNTLYYLRQLVGGHLAEPILADVHISGIFVAGLYLCLILSCLQTKKDLILLKPKQKLWSAFICACVCAVLFVAVLIWTPSDSPTMWGMQGRYLLPILPLVMLILQGKTIVLEKEITDKLAFAMCMLNFFVLLNAFVVIIN